MTNLMKKRLNKKGFTLVELIVVIAIVAVLAVVGIPAIAGQVAKANQASVDANAKTIASQAQIMITENEVKGDTTRPADADIIKAAGVDSTKLDSIVITISGAGTAAAPYSCDTVEVTKGKVVGTWTRV